ncbi:MAG: ATP-binding protein [Magnetococcales bacterium]|nr:ATP-binding protein [Magnetococcales bacterium]
MPTQESANVSPYVVGPMIRDPKYFFGRESELTFLYNRMTGPQLTSVNIYGPRRIGKSSLMYHFYQTWQNSVENRTKYIVAYIDLKAINCTSTMLFYQTIADGLRRAADTTVPSHTKIIKSLHNVDNYQDFESALLDFEQSKICPILCIDEFEVLLKRIDQFDNNFFNNMRSLTNRSMIMLIITSIIPLGRLKFICKLTSEFFNGGNHINLGGFKEKEIGLFLRASQFYKREKEEIRFLGKNHPFALALAATDTIETRTSGGIEQARKKFHQEIQVHRDVLDWLESNNQAIQP